jgi:hypothetical protein
LVGGVDLQAVLASDAADVERGQGNRILFLDETEENPLQHVGGEAGAVAFAPQSIV